MKYSRGKIPKATKTQKLTSEKKSKKIIYFPNCCIYFVINGHI